MAKNICQLQMLFHAALLKAASESAARFSWQTKGVVGVELRRKPAVTVVTDSQREELRQQLAKMTRAYERKNGKVKTLPLRVGAKADLPLEVRVKTALSAHFVR